MNISNDLHATHRRETLRRWADEQHRQEEKERGSPLPALIALGLLGLGVWLGIIWLAK